MKGAPSIKVNTIASSFLLFILMLTYIVFGVSSELTGDYLVYWDMYLNGSIESFENQPIFTVYYEIIRSIIPTPEIFFVIMLLPWLVVISNCYFKSLFMRRPVVFILLLILFCSFILKPSMLLFLLRQNLAILIFLALLPSNIFIASLLAIGFHYSFLPIIVIAYIFSIVINRLPNAFARLSVYLLAIILIFLFSSEIFNNFSSLSMTGIPVIDTYINLYKHYDDIFPNFAGLRIFIFIASLIYIIFINKMSFVYKWVGAITTSIFLISIALSFSDPLSYRFLQVAKMPSFILILWYVYWQTNDKSNPEYFRGSA